jgi:hypothetical protein
MTESSVDLLEEFVLCCLLVTVDVGGDVFELNHVECFIFEKVRRITHLHVDLVSVFNHTELLSSNRVLALIENLVERGGVEVGIIKEFFVNEGAFEKFPFGEISCTSAHQLLHDVFSVLGVFFFYLTSLKLGFETQQESIVCVFGSLAFEDDQWPLEIFKNVFHFDPGSLNLVNLF